MKNIPQAVRYRVAQRVRLLRGSKSLTQERLAQLAGLAPRHVQKIEAARVNVTLDSLAKIANALDMDISQLFVDERDVDT